MVATAWAQPQDQKKGTPPKSVPAVRPAPAPHPAPPPPHIAAPPRATPHMSAPRTNFHPPPRVVGPAAPRIEHAAPRIEHAAPRIERPAPRVLNVPAQTARTQNSPQSARAARRQERILRRQEERALRALPPPQRAQRREEIQRARQERAQQRLAPASALQQVQPTTPTTQRATRLNGQPRIAPQFARQGHFAGAFATRPNRSFAYAYPRQAWRHGLRVAFLPWYGPVTRTGPTSTTMCSTACSGARSVRRRASNIRGRELRALRASGNCAGTRAAASPRGRSPNCKAISASTRSSAHCSTTCSRRPSKRNAYSETRVRHSKRSRSRHLAA
jgi:hypothetical protein